MKKIKITNIEKTSYSDDSYWIEYEFENFFAYKKTDEYDTNTTYKEIEREFNCNQELITNLTNKLVISKCSTFLINAIENLLYADNDMYFVENEEFEDYIVSNGIKNKSKFINDLKEEVYKLGLHEDICFGEDDCFMTLYGNVLELVAFEKKDYE